MKYYKLKTCPPIVGADQTYLLKADNQEKANEIGFAQAQEDYNSYEIEDDGCEPEYGYVVTEISEETYIEMRDEDQITELN